MDKLILSIVISGENIFGQPICEIKGAYISEKGKVKPIEINTPVNNVNDVVNAIEDLFAEEE